MTRLPFSVPPDSAMRVVSHAIRAAPSPKEECALEIIRSGALRQRELHYPPSIVTGMLLLRGLAPDFLDTLIRSNVIVENVRRAPPPHGTGVPPAGSPGSGR